MARHRKTDGTGDNANERSADGPVLRLDQYLPYRLNVLAETVREPLSRHYAERHGIGLPEWRVAAVLGQHGTLTAKEIGQIGRMHKTKVSRALAVLEAKQLVIRETNRQDMRESFVSLSEEGRRMYAHLADTALTYGERLSAALSEDERAAFEAMLHRLMAHSEELAREWTTPPARGPRHANSNGNGHGNGHVAAGDRLHGHSRDPDGPGGPYDA